MRQRSGGMDRPGIGVRVDRRYGVGWTDRCGVAVKSEGPLPLLVCW